MSSLMLIHDLQMEDPSDSGVESPGLQVSLFLLIEMMQ